MNLHQEKLEKAIDRAGCLSPHSARQYRRFIKDFSAMSKDCDTFDTLSPNDLLTWMRQKGWSAQTRAQCMSALRWADRTVGLNIPALDHVKTRGFLPVKDTFLLTESELKQISTLTMEVYSKNQARALRNKALIVFIIETLATVDDLLVARIEDVHQKDVTMRLRPMGESIVTISKEAAMTICMHINNAKLKDGTKALFPSKHKGQPITQSGIHRALSPVIEQLIPRYKIARSGSSVALLRNSAARVLLNNGAHESEVMKKMGIQKRAMFLRMIPD